MSKEVLDTLYIAFKSSGAQEIRTQITNLEKHLEEFSKKIASVHDKALSPALKGLESIAKRTSSALSQSHAKIISSTRLVKKELGGITAIQREFNREVKKTSELGKALKDIAKGSSRISVRIGGGGGGGRVKSPEEQAQAEEEKRLRAEQKANALAERERIRNAKAAYNAIMRTATTLIATAKIATKVYTREISDAQKGQSFYNKIFLSGLTNRKAVTGGIRIGQYGGSPEEFFAASQALSTSLGAMTRGDTSLIEHLGKYGIGGISPKGTPEDVINAIKARIGRGDLSKNEINSLLAGLPFSEAMKMSIVKGHDLFKDESREFDERKAIQEELLKAARGQFDLLKATTNLTSEMSGLTNRVSDLISENSDFISITKKILDPAKDALLTLAGMKAVFGTGKTAGTFAEVVTKLSLASKALLVAGAAYGGWKIGRFIGETLGVDNLTKAFGDEVSKLFIGDWSKRAPTNKEDVQETYKGKRGFWQMYFLQSDLNYALQQLNSGRTLSTPELENYDKRFEGIQQWEKARARYVQTQTQTTNNNNQTYHYNYYYGGGFGTGASLMMQTETPQMRWEGLIGNALLQ